MSQAKAKSNDYNHEVCGVMKAWPEQQRVRGILKHDTANKLHESYQHKCDDYSMKSKISYKLGEFYDKKKHNWSDFVPDSSRLDFYGKNNIYNIKCGDRGSSRSDIESSFKNVPKAKSYIVIWPTRMGKTPENYLNPNPFIP